MPARSKYSKRYKKKPGYSLSKRRVFRIPKGIRVPNQYNFKRVVTLYNGAAPARYGSISNTAYDTLANYALSFNLAQLPSYTEFTQLFDQYKIYKIQLNIRPQAALQNVTVSTTANSFSYPYIHYVIDKDDDTALSTVTDYQQYPGYKRQAVGRSFRVSFTPCVATQIYQSGISTGYSQSKAWIDCGSSTVPHYGWKFGINGAGLGVTSSYAIDIEATFTIGLRGVR